MLDLLDAWKVSDDGLVSLERSCLFHGILN